MVVLQSVYFNAIVRSFSKEVISKGNVKQFPYAVYNHKRSPMALVLDTCCKERQVNGIRILLPRVLHLKMRRPLEQYLRL